MENGNLPPPADPAAAPEFSPATAPETSPDTALVQPEFSRASLARLRGEGVLTAEAFDEALAFCGFRPDAEAWRLYWRHILLLGGALFLVAGIIFFIAWNWADMHRFARMALVGAVVAGTGLAAVWRGPDTALGKVLLLSCGICVGPLLAVFGQTYQTGAELWELFRVWTIVLFALSLAGRQAALWFVTWLSGNVFVMLWLGRSMDSPLEALGMFSLLPECVLGLALAVAVWEWAAYTARQRGRAGQQAWLQSRWLPRLLFFDLTVRLTCYLCLTIFGGYAMRHLTVFMLPREILPLLAMAVAGVSWYWHRRKTPDLFMFACLVTAAAVLVVAVLLKAEFLFEAEVWAVFLWGLLLVGLTAGVAAILMALQRTMESHGESHGAKTGEVYSGAAIAAFFAPARQLPGWSALWSRLKAQGLLAEDTPLPLVQKAAAPKSPWYVRAILAVGGWVASVVFLAFLALFLFLTLNIRSSEGAMLFMASLVPLGVAYACLQRPGIFMRNFGFSLALTGTAGVCCGLGWMTDFSTAMPFAWAVILAALCFVIHNSPYRFLAALCAVQCVAAGIIAVSTHFGSSGEGQWEAYRYSLYVAAVWWVAVSLALAAFSLREGVWRGLPRGRRADSLFFGAYGGMMVCLILFLAVWADGMLLRELGTDSLRIPSGAYTVGLGAAAGLVYLVHGLVKGKGLVWEKALVAGCAVLFLPLGWLLPGVALAAFGLMLSRYLGNLVMQGVTGAFLFAYMIHYYYFLGLPLLHKSLLLAGTGVILLALAFCLDRFGKRFFAKEGSHA